MRNFTFVFVLLFAAVLSFAQGDQSRQARIDSLETVKKDLTNRLKAVEAELTDLKTVKVETPIPTTPSEYIKIKIKNPFDLKDKFDHKVMLSVGDIIELLSLENNYFQVRYNGTEYKAWKFSVINNWKAMTTLSFDEINAEWEKWDAPNRIQREKEQQRIVKQQAAKRKKASLAKAEERKQSLIDRYGSSITERILNREIWIGMTRAMALESRGTPEKNNRSVNVYGTHEQWVYENIYLYFENDLLTSWQD